MNENGKKWLNIILVALLIIFTLCAICSIFIVIYNAQNLDSLVDRGLPEEYLGTMFSQYRISLTSAVFNMIRQFGLVAITVFILVFLNKSKLKEDMAVKKEKAVENKKAKLLAKQEKLQKELLKYENKN